MIQGQYEYGWLDDMVCVPLEDCKVCGTQLVEHMYGRPLTVCPRCFPTEVAA